MRDKNRIKPVLDQIKSIWSTFPDLRLGQLLLNTMSENELYNIEDEQLVKKLTEYIQFIQKQKP